MSNYHNMVNKIHENVQHNKNVIRCNDVVNLYTNRYQSWVKYSGYRADNIDKPLDYR